MKKIPAFVIFICAFSATFSQQSVLLFALDFDNDTTTINFDTPGAGANFGLNDWAVNDSFSGHGIYHDTPPEDSVVAGQINSGNAPYSNYLHIHNVPAALGNSGPANANWSTGSASDRFCDIGNDICTLGLDSVVFSFFWICEGDSSAYGQIYYSANGGPWIQTGRPKYFNQSKWQYEVIQNAGFNNVQNLQFGFRWVNSGADSAANTSFGIDDIVVAAAYHNPVQMSVTVGDDTVCQSGYQFVQYSLSNVLCDGTYDITMIGTNGIVTSTYDLGIFDIDATETSGGIGTEVPANVTGGCFRVIISRVSPEPSVISDTSACFSIIDCPVTIYTDFAPVMTDVDTTCVNSAIDVSFFSFGNMNTNNVYYGEFSDTNGSFAHPDTFGLLVSNMSYPGPQPGTVSGLIPANLPLGCGYYIRIVSSGPSDTGSTIGPFCVKQCDITTNNTQDIRLCVNYPNATDTAVINVKTNSWSGGDTYDNCNSWTVELLDMNSFSVVNTGGLGVFHDSTSGNFKIIAGPLSSLPVAPGSYYLRIISSCPDQQWDSAGTVIRLTIGAPEATPGVISSSTSDSVFCNSGILELTLTPYNPSCQYYWNSNLYDNSYPIYVPGNTFFGNLTGAPQGQYKFYEREDNYGCYGPYSAPYDLYIVVLPVVHITVNSPVCIGDTANFETAFIPATYYSWTAPLGTHVSEQGNNQVAMVFDQEGTFSITNTSTNVCGTGSGTCQVKVTAASNLYLTDSVCIGQKDTLRAVANYGTRTFTSFDTTSLSGEVEVAFFNIISNANIIIDSFAVEYDGTNTTVLQDIYGKTGTFQGFEQDSAAWTLLGSSSVPVVNPVGQMTVIPIYTSTTVAAGDTFAFYVVTRNTNPMVAMGITDGTFNEAVGSVFKSDSVISYAVGGIGNIAFSGFLPARVLNTQIYYKVKSPLTYLWNNGDTNPTIYFTPSQTGAIPYSVSIASNLNCTSRDSFLVNVVDCSNGIKEVSAGLNLLSINPNPSSGLIYIDAPTGILNVEIYDLNGKKVWEAKEWQPVLDLYSLAQGAYVIQVGTPDGIFRKMLVLVR